MNFVRSNEEATKDLKFYGAANGLSDVRVYNMNEDADGNLWAGTANGLFRYVRSRDAFVRQDDSRFPTTSHTIPQPYTTTRYISAPRQDCSVYR